MQKYDLYVGLGGSFGGASYYGTYEYNSEEEALQDAYNLAVEKYESTHNLRSWNDCKEDLMTQEDITEEDIDQYYFEVIERWIVYYVKLHDDNKDLR